MTYLILFVVVPVLMLFGLWLAGNDKQVRGVMVTGASIVRFTLNLPQAWMVFQS